MTTHRVTKEQAIMLKEFGYREKVGAFYTLGTSSTKPITAANFEDENWHKSTASAPTLDEAANWIRDLGLHIYTIPFTDFQQCTFKIHFKGIFNTEVSFEYPDHASALSAAISSALDHLKTTTHATT